jgi:hypothetical protein
MTSNGKGVGGQGSLNFGVVEVDHLAILFDHIHLKQKHPHENNYAHRPITWQLAI